MADRIPTNFLNGKSVIKLIDEADFWLGRLHVKPSCREIATPAGNELIEPRVLQVLVCLAKNDGQVISRDELITRCWQRRIVSEDAINRCIGKVRKLGELCDTPSFSLETIPRIGYRLTGVTTASLSYRRACEATRLIDEITADKTEIELAAIRERLHALIG
jgi:DNA-binding winged helix-turn-helix (wHTH) protein